jgi:hypothetical protein
VTGSSYTAEQDAATVRQHADAVVRVAQLGPEAGTFAARAGRPGPSPVGRCAGAADLSGETCSLMYPRLFGRSNPAWSAPSRGGADRCW